MVAGPQMVGRERVFLAVFGLVYLCTLVSTAGLHWCDEWGECFPTSILFGTEMHFCKSYDSIVALTQRLDLSYRDFILPHPREIVPTARNLTENF